MRLIRGLQRAAALRSRARKLVIAARQLRAAAAADDVSEAVAAHRRHREAIQRKGKISGIYPMSRCVNYDYSTWRPDVLCHPRRGCCVCDGRRASASGTSDDLSGTPRFCAAASSLTHFLMCFTQRPTRNAFSTQTYPITKGCICGGGGKARAVRSTACYKTQTQ